MKSIMLNNGRQERPYADHIWKWEVSTDKNETKEQVLEWCKNNLRKAEREESDYLNAYRFASSFEETMSIVCGGRYKLECLGDGKYEYTVQEEYID